MKTKVRRFDIFAIVNYLKNSSSMDEAKAKGEAIWLAKLVANRKLYGGSKKAKADTPHKNKKTGEVQYWKALSGIPQTNEEYDKAIVDRFGKWDYAVLVSLIKEKLEEGFGYKDIRDCEHAHRGYTGWCPTCSANFVEEFRKQLK